MVILTSMEVNEPEEVEDLGNELRRHRVLAEATAINMEQHRTELEAMEQARARTNTAQRARSTERAVNMEEVRKSPLEASADDSL